MQGFYFLVKFRFGRSYLYIKGIPWKILFDFIEKKYSLLVFFVWKAFTFLNSERFLCWKSRNDSQHFFLEIFFWDLSINYWGSIFTLNITFSLVCVLSLYFTAQKMKFSIKHFFSKCDQIRRKLRIWLHLLKKFLMENFIFCTVSFFLSFFFFSFSIGIFLDRH